jgi:ribosomal protein S18 acetylase RimI-like enzyme
MNFRNGRCNMEDFDIRIATPDDKAEIERLTRELVKEKGEEFIEKRFEWGLLRRIYDPLQRHGVFVAVQKSTNKMVGMIFAELRIDPFGNSEGYIKQLHISSEYRRKTLGTRLLEVALEHMSKINVQKVKVQIPQDATNNQMVVKLFNNFKFKPKYTVLEMDLNKK